MNAGYVYVLAFTNGTVKVGRTQDTGSRLNAHKSDARKFGLTVTGQWLSPLHAEWHQNEEALKKIAADLGGTAHTKEYFSGVSFAAVVAEAARLPFTPEESITGQVVPQGSSGPVLPRPELGSLSHHDRAVRLAHLRVRRDEAQDAADALYMDWAVAEAANEFLNMNLPPSLFRELAMANPAKPFHLYLRVADVMEVQIREEAAIARHLAGAVA